MDLPQQSEYVYRDPLGQMIRVRAEASAWRAVPGGSKSWMRGRARPFPSSWPADDSRGDDIVSLPPLIASVVQFLRTG